MWPEWSLGRRGVALSQEKQIGYCLSATAAARNSDARSIAPGSSPAASDLAHNPLRKSKTPQRRHSARRTQRWGAWNLAHRLAPKWRQRPLSGRSFRVEAAVGDLEPCATLLSASAGAARAQS